jgi:putative FmdB family regulatory protein
MPIYEYRCSSCGHQQEFLQKVSDKPITVCTQCGKETFSKMLTAAGFQLKGSGWYATDFKNTGRAPAKTGDAKSSDSKPTESKSTDSTSTESKSTDSKSPESKPAAESKSDAPKAASPPPSGSGTPSS